MGRDSAQPKLRRGVQLLARNSAKLEELDERFFNQVVRARRARSDANHNRPLGKPIAGNYFLLLMQIVVLDLLRREQPRRIQNKICRQSFLSHLGQVRSVGTVVTAHDDEEVHLHIEQFAQRVLAFLGGAANRVKESEIFRTFLGSVAIDNCLADSALNLFGLAPQHGGLVGHTDCPQMHVGVEPS